MRIAFNTFPDSLISQLANYSSQQYKLQNQASTGKRITQLEDDPSAMRQVLNWQSDDGRLNQYRTNIASLQGAATSAYTAMSSLQKISQRASEIATLADGTKSPQDLQTYATEVTQLIQQGVQLMNSRYQGDYLFGGTQTAQAPFVLAADASGNATSVTYQGNSSEAGAEIAGGMTISVLVPGANTTGSGPTGLITDSRTGADFFNHLISLQNHLLAGDTGAISATDQAALTKDGDHLATQMGAAGLIQNQLSDADSVAAAQSESVKGMISQASDADLATTLTQLRTTQTAYQAALQSGASLLSSGQSLLDYLK